MLNMGQTRSPRLVTPLVAMLAGSPAHFQAARKPLEALLGPLELESPLYPFEKTSYYTPSMGEGLLRQFFSFVNLHDPVVLVDWKLATNLLEEELKPSLQIAGAPERPINLDPGYITGAKLVLASTKDFAHRLYIRDGIFAEITMGFRGDSWVGHDFTFPDYKNGTYHAFFKRVRDRHLRKVKKLRRDQEET